MNAMRNPWGMSAVLALAIVATSSSASADAPFDTAIDVQTFNYAIGPKTFFTVSDGDVAAPKQLAVDALVTYLTKPFTVYNYDPANPDVVGSERTQVVKSLTAMQITAAYGVNEKLQVGANLPIIFQLAGDGLMADTGRPAPNGLSVTGLGDIMVEGKYRLYKKDALKIAGIVGLTLPSSFGSDDSQFIGDNLPTLQGRMALQYDVGKLSFGANGGVLLRKPRKIYDSTIGPQLTWGAAAAIRITDRFSIIGESYGRTGIPDFSLDASPLEAEGGLRLYATSSVAVVLGGGAGLVKGVGSPRSRFFISVGYAPDVRDSDGDGVQNARDKCPLIPEDKDGHDDEDGCPDDDNDGDRRPDATDKCPEVAEDLDGFDDDDGCPELDNDGDKIDDMKDKCPVDAEDGKQPYPNDGCPANKRDSDGDGLMDAVDLCPTEEEDVDAFEDGDGCPEADNDADGIPDATDKCGLCPEDKDGFEDADGCPELDNDKDGVVDKKDVCPAEPETINGIKDDDGCPDTGGAIIAKVDGDRLIIERMPTMKGNALSVQGTLIIDQIAMLMIVHNEVSKWLLAMSQPAQADAQKLADAVKARLIAKGVPEERLQIVGAQGAPKIGGVVQERTDDATPVCPESLRVKERAEAMKAGAKPVAEIKAAPEPEPEVEMGPVDKDGDDIADADDKCPDQPETKNSYQDEDGCPDTIPAALKKFSGSVQGVNFKSGSADILPQSLRVLDGAAKAFAEFPDLKVEIQGHTDDVPPGKGGAFPDNVALSQARADAVKTYLVGKGIDGARLTAKGFGDSLPITSPAKLKGGKLNAARTKNRRVEFKLQQ
jgi:outer membrane protein OmpA-like peptidoglycan-associated protein